MKFTLRIILAVTIFFIFLSDVQGQYFSTGQDPASVQWRQINTPDFQLIYPSSYEKKAQYLANVFSLLIERGGYTLKHKPRKFSVVIHTHGSISNGLVAWAPKKMELYATPSQNLYPQPWLDQLALHEYRHVVQLDKIEQGFTRFLNFIFGQQATAAVIGMYLPPWFLEGDAVASETALSCSGRGRLPYFQQELRAQLLEKGIYSYDKAVLGSFKDYVPNRYKLGYHMVALGRKNYGPDLWEKTLTRVGRNPLGVTPFSTGIKETLKERREKVVQEKVKWIENSSLFASNPIDVDSLFKSHERADAKIMLYHDNMSELLWDWKIQDQQNTTTRFRPLNSDVKIYSNYRYPHSTDNQGIIQMKSGLADVNHFVSVKDGKEEPVFVPGSNITSSFDIYNGVLLWSEMEDHIRWQHGDRATLILYDINTKQRRKIKYEYNLFAPVFSNDGKKIMAVEVRPDGHNSLVVLDRETGLVVKRIEAGNRDLFLTPQWGSEEDVVFSVVLNEKGKRLEKINIESKQTQILMNSTYCDISQPHIAGKHLFFTAGFNGIDNIYAMDLDDKKIYQVTFSRFGARDPQINFESNTLLYSDYCSDGYKGVEIELNFAEWKPINKEAFVYDLAESIASHEKGIVTVEETPIYNSDTYSKFGHLLNFHSWAPIFIDGLEQDTDVGFSVASQNKLNTLLLTAGYRREQGFTHGQYYANLSYRGWFPVIDTKITCGGRKFYSYAYWEENAPQQIDTIIVREKHNLWQWESSVRFPFNISRGQYQRKVIPKITYTRLQVANRDIVPLYRLENGTLKDVERRYEISQSGYSLGAMEYQLLGYNIAKSAARDIQPRWGQIVELNYRNMPWGDVNAGESWAGEGTFYLPGFAKHHGLKLYGGYQNNSSMRSPFSNTVKSPRGMNMLNGEEITSLGVDYKFPLFYPDWNIGPLAYVKRLRLGLFYDHGYSEGVYENFQFKNQGNSLGVEINSDMHILRFTPSVDMGIRIGLEDNWQGDFNLFTQFLFSIDLSSF